MLEHHLPALLIVIVVFGLAFDFTNGFHDTANAVATVIATRVLPPMFAILMSAVLNFCGALVATNVAKTIAKGLIDTHAASGIPFQQMILAAIVGAIIWNVITWYFGIPNSSSHALIGGLVGAALVYAGPHAVLWGGVLNKVVLPMVFSPLLGGAIGFLIMMLLFTVFGGFKPDSVSHIFHNLQRLSAAAVSFSHGQNDAQKTMGVITLALVAFGQIPNSKDVHIPLWVVLSCATAMGLGTATGGWRIIKTLGTRIIRLEPINGFAAEASASIVILAASHFGVPVSTTHVVSGSVFGVGGAKRLSGVRWTVAQRMVATWVITLPAAAGVSALFLLALRSASAHLTVAVH